MGRTQARRGREEPELVTAHWRRRTGDRTCDWRGWEARARRWRTGGGTRGKKQGERASISLAGNRRPGERRQEARWPGRASRQPGRAAGQDARLPGRAAGRLGRVARRSKRATERRQEELRSKTLGGQRGDSSARDELSWRRLGLHVWTLF
jgi:hypothetical protein